jgi:hypothetical protein
MRDIRDDLKERLETIEKEKANASIKLERTLAPSRSRGGAFNMPTFSVCVKYRRREISHWDTKSISRHEKYLVWRVCLV